MELFRKCLFILIIRILNSYENLAFDNLIVQNKSSVVLIVKKIEKHSERKPCLVIFGTFLASRISFEFFLTQLNLLLLC